jgi:excisionase family DNA binding protein
VDEIKLVRRSAVCQRGAPSPSGHVTAPKSLGVEHTSQPRLLALLSLKGAADYAQVSIQTVRRWVKGGHLKYYRAGRQIRIDESDLVHFLSP